MMDHITPFVSVIIPALNGERTIRECLVSLLNMDYPVERREILVVDNGSTDRTAEIVKSFPVRYLREEQRGVSYALNRGIEVGKGDILVFTNAHCVVTSSWLRELVQGFEREEVGIVAGEMVAYPPKTTVERYTAKRKPLLFQVYNLNNPDLPWFSAGNVAIRREVVNQIGLFDPRLPGGEDIDYSWRFFQSGTLKLIYRLRAVVFHRHHPTAWGLYKQYRAFGFAQAVLCRKYQKELSWGWRRELGAYRDLFLSALALGGAGFLSMLKGQEATRFSYLQYELIRKLGERIGFIRGTLRRKERYG